MRYQACFVLWPIRECPKRCRRKRDYSSPRLSRVAMSTQQRIHHLGSGESLSAGAAPTPQSGSPCALQHLGWGKPALLVARGCTRCVRAPPAEGLTHSTASRPLSSSSLLSEGEFETEVEELEGREDNVRERGVSPLPNRWRKSPTTSPSQSAVPRFAAGIVSTTACTASRSRVLRSSWLAILVSAAA